MSVTSTLSESLHVVVHVPWKRPSHKKEGGSLSSSSSTFSTETPLEESPPPTKEYKEGTYMEVKSATNHPKFASIEEFSSSDDVDDDEFKTPLSMPSTPTGVSGPETGNSSSEKGITSSTVEKLFQELKDVESREYEYFVPYGCSTPSLLCLHCVASSF
eukprot:TRINITY_DN903_c2_g2_i1.p1 TRINITY_DN903_c2_g2~~TRINITY_DN903_c2_g2_i1.p1  ORF type:complete len:159 (+),score=40.17 TRINITY_DN903_c2_g2_i1:221-697(+)